MLLIILTCTFIYVIAIVKGMTGSPDKVTNAVDINRIPTLYDRIIASLKRCDFANFDFIKQVCV